MANAIIQYFTIIFYMCIIKLVIEMDILEKIKEEINKIRPFLQSDGGNIEFVKFEDGYVYVKLTGACSHCAMIDITLKEGVEEILVNEIPEVKRVIRVD